LENIKIKRQNVPLVGRVAQKFSVPTFGPFPYFQKPNGHSTFLWDFLPCGCNAYHKKRIKKKSTVGERCIIGAIFGFSATIKKNKHLKLET
jgi:hypothetical protein